MDPFEETRFGAMPREAALALGADIGDAAVRRFFEAHFTPHVYSDTCEPGFVTGYYEPELRGSRNRHSRFHVPVLGLPDDLIPLSADLYRALHNKGVSVKRQCGDELADYFTRAEIESGALEGRGLELLFLEDWVELFYMQVQGSGLVHLDDGSDVRLTYAGKNGHPYTSIGRLLVERHEIALNAIDMEQVKAWLRADPARGRALMQENKSYIFFHVLGGDEGRLGPLGAKSVPLTPGRSLAVDPVYVPLGCPVYLVADDLVTTGAQQFSRLMIAQDVGSAIRGQVRGDIFWGTGESAGAIAGTTRHRAQFIFLMPNR